MEYFPVLAYHKISTQKEFGLTTVSPQIFEKHLSILLNHQFTPITFQTLHNGGSLPEKPVIITFDDGYESVYLHAYPIMQKYSIPGVVYLLTDFIGLENTWEAFKIQRGFRHLDKEQILALAASGWEIGSHGLDHKYSRFLSSDRILRTMTQSRSVLENITGQKIISYCFPYGRSRKREQDISVKAGYKFAVGNIKAGYNNHANLQHIGRRSIYSIDSDILFKKKLAKPHLLSTSIWLEALIRLGAYAGIARNI